MPRPFRSGERIESAFDAVARAGCSIVTRVVPQGLVVENYDITTILEKVAYFVKAAEESENNQ